LKAAFGGSYIANENFTQATATQVLETGEADAVAFGVPEGSMTKGRSPFARFRNLRTLAGGLSSPSAERLDSKRIPYLNQLWRMTCLTGCCKTG
jgi:hypothetical protein